MQFNNYQIIKTNANNILFNDYIELIRLETSVFKQNLESQYDNDDDIEFIYVKTSTNEVVGYITYKDLDISYDIYMFAVKEAYRHKGIASLIIEQLSIKDVILEVRETNKAAIKFYEKHGFKHIQTKRKYYQTEDAYVYYKEAK